MQANEFASAQRKDGNFREKGSGKERVELYHYLISEYILLPPQG